MINGTTSFDRTNYFEVVPANQLETALWLESDRMGYLLDLLEGRPYGRLLREAQNWSRAQVLEQERKRFGLDRHTAGALLLSAWGLPRSAVHTQRAASQPVTAEAQRLAALYEPRRANSSPLCSRTKRL